jgi:hypothetical protein
MRETSGTCPLIVRFRAGREGAFELDPALATKLDVKSGKWDLLVLAKFVRLGTSANGRLSGALDVIASIAPGNG